MDQTFLVQLVGTAFGAAGGGFATYVAIKVEVALAKQRAEDAHGSAKGAHERLDAHIDKHHTRAGQ